MRRSFSPAKRILVLLLWTILSISTLLPVYRIIVVFTRSRVEPFGRPNFWPTFLERIYWKNYAKPFLNGPHGEYLLNSIIIATSNAALVTMLAVMATYALSRWRLTASDNIFFWTITNRMAPPAAFLLPLFLTFTQLFRVGDATLFDTRIGLILLFCVFNLPFAIWLLKGIVDGIPKELDEAVLLDGGTTFTVLTRVIVPLAVPGIAVTALLSWVFAWNGYLFAATLTSVNARTVTTGLAEFVTATGTQLGRDGRGVGRVHAASPSVPCGGAAVHHQRHDLRGGEGVTPMPRRNQNGFLPIRTNWFDRLFISVVLYIAGHLVWMRFVEFYVPIEVCTVLFILLGTWIVRRG